MATFPHPDEERIAMRLYAREIEESGVLTRIAQEIIEEHERRS